MGTNKINVAIAGIGNCASSLVQGIEHYSERKKIPGLLFEKIGGYSISDINIVAAFDIADNKVGRPLSDAIFAVPNNTTVFQSKIRSDVIVQRGPTLDGLGQKLREIITESEAEPVDISHELKEKEVDVLINYMPVGSYEASRYYANSCLEAKCAFINAMPTFIVSDPEWSSKFKKNNIPCIGDDVKSQLGATILHRSLVELFQSRGIEITQTHQLNYGGNSDFYNMQEPNRLNSKLISKTEAVTSLLHDSFNSDGIFIGPAGYVPWLKDKKHAEILIRGKQFGGDEIEVEIKLKVTDSPNSAGVMVDAIRCAKLALDRGESGYLKWPSAYYMKHPPEAMGDETARAGLLKWIGD